MPPKITIKSLPHAELHYRILTHLDLGADAANIYRSRRRTPTWASELLEVYQRAPGRLTLQVLPLWARDLDEELDLLRPGALESLDDDAGRRLATLFAERLRAEEATLPSPTPNPPTPDWLETLTDCRQHLWSELDEDCPPLRIVDVPALRCGQWTHGRATGRAERTVAVSLDAGRAAFVQILHEEIHPVTDPVVRASFDNIRQDTRQGSAGYGLHSELERTAVEVGQALIEARAPEFVDDYCRWRERFST